MVAFWGHTRMWIHGTLMTHKSSSKLYMQCNKMQEELEHFWANPLLEEEHGGTIKA